MKGRWNTPEPILFDPTTTEYKRAVVFQAARFNHNVVAELLELLETGELKLTGRMQTDIKTAEEKIHENTER